MTQDTSFGSGVKCSNVDPIRCADSEAEKALKRARLFEDEQPRKLQGGDTFHEFVGELGL